MDVIFCNDFADNLPLMIEFQASVMRRNPFYYFINALYILTVLYCVFFTDGIEKAVGVFVFLILIIMYDVYLVLNVKNHAKRELERQKELNSGRISGGLTEVTNDALLCKSYNGAYSEVPLNNMEKAYETKHLIVIKSKTANLYYTFKKDAFTKGTYPEFMEFLKQKGLYK